MIFLSLLDRYYSDLNHDEGLLCVSVKVEERDPEGCYERARNNSGVSPWVTFGRHDWLKRKLMHADVGWMIVGPPKMSLSSAALSSA